jgi:hypothetical protein
MQAPQIENMNSKILVRSALFIRDEMCEVLSNLASAICTNPNCLHDFKVDELLRAYELLHSFAHWSENAEVVSMAASWLTLRLVEVQEESDLELGLERQSREQIEKCKEEFRQLWRQEGRDLPY